MKIKKNLTRTFIRFQENYESPEFRGKIFSLKEYKKWYIKNDKKSKKYGKFFYFSQWGGFNIPSYVLENFYNGKFKNITERERKILKIFEKIRGQNFYIIGIFKSNKKIQSGYIDHETAHGLFYTNKDYKKKVLKIVEEEKNKTLKSLFKFLKNSSGYHPDVYLDELQAYCVNGYAPLTKDSKSFEETKKTAEKIQKIYKEFLGKYKK